MSTSVLLTREKQVMFGRGVFLCNGRASDSISIHDGSPGVTQGRNSVTWSCVCPSICPGAGAVLWLFFHRPDPRDGAFRLSEAG